MSLAPRWFLDLGGRLEDTVLVAGTGRSGTTWLANIINYDNTFRLIFEPFRDDKVDLAKPFAYRRYLRPNERGEVYLRAMDKILRGRFRNSWTDQFNRRWIARRRLIKAIRVNLLLKWIKVHFPPVRIVLLLRHPCAVASSQTRVGWEVNLERLFLHQENLMADHLAPFVPALKGAADSFQRSVLLWCVETYIPLRLLRQDEYCLVFYESLLLHPRLEIERLFSFLERPFNDRVWKAFAAPSQMASPEGSLHQGEEPATSWRAFVSEDRVRWAREALSWFGLESLYDEDGMPSPSACLPDRANPRIV